MSNALHFEICPETGICTILSDRSSKIDLMPFEVDAVRDAAGDTEQIKAILEENDPGFAEDITTDELAQIGQQLA